MNSEKPKKDNSLGIIRGFFYYASAVIELLSDLTYFASLSGLRRSSDWLNRKSINLEKKSRIQK